MAREPKTLVFSTTTTPGLGADTLPRKDATHFLHEHVLDYGLVLCFPDRTSLLAREFVGLCDLLSRQDAPSLAVFALPLMEDLKRQSGVFAWPPEIPELQRFLTGGRAPSSPPVAHTHSAVVAMLWHLMDYLLQGVWASEVAHLHGDERPSDWARRMAEGFASLSRNYAEVHSPQQKPQLAPDFLECQPAFAQYLKKVAPQVVHNFSGCFPEGRSVPFALIPSTQQVFAPLLKHGEMGAVLVLLVERLDLAPREQVIIRDLGRAALDCWTRSLPVLATEVVLELSSSGYWYGGQSLELKKGSGAELLLNVLTQNEGIWVRGAELRKERVSNPSEAAKEVQKALSKAGCPNPTAYLKTSRHGYQWAGRVVHRRGATHRSKPSILPE